MVDLHTHSTFSDGSVTPAGLAALARQAGVSSLALTDHDTTDGVPEFLSACGREGVCGIAGVEVSVEVTTGTMHVLAYGMDLGNAPLQEVLGHIRVGRADRNKVILQRLSSLGYPLAWEEVSGLAGDEMVGRPHYAQALVNRGYIKSRQDAFDRLLAKGKPAYVERARLTPEECIEVIRGAGGVAVLAHPFTLKMGPRELSEQVRRLASQGLGGVEAYYSEHTPAMQEQYRAMAASLGLFVTGGSDFHGEGNPAIRIGRGFGNLEVPDDVIGPLKAAIGSCAAAARP